jgi:sugar (pentulose or hexulose) kinase
VSLGIYDGYKQIKRVLKKRERFEPDPRTAAEYERLYKAFRDLHPPLSKASKMLNTAVQPT